jgi:hypothetical protein
MDIAYDSLDIISWSLSEQLERLAKVLPPFLAYDYRLYARYRSKLMQTDK